MPISHEIHPGIGVARVGDSNEFFIGPEPNYPDAAFYQSQPVMRAQRTAPPAKFRDTTPQKLLKRQAARFRVFACERDAGGELLSARELKPTEATITWTVRLANRKAAATQFEDPTQGARNPDPVQNLVIAPPARSLTGVSQPAVDFTGGKFKGKNVYLGSALTDDKGRLIVVGGKGESIGVPATAAIDNFADNDNWCDDTSDGPVTAAITLADGSTPVVTGAWVIVAPFDFAPQVDSFITFYDVAYQAAADIDPSLTPQPYETDFERDVNPILKRTRGYRWVNGPSMRAETQDRHVAWRDKLGMLADPNPANLEGQRWRKALFDHLPDPAAPNAKRRQVLMPRLHTHDPDYPNPKNDMNLVLPLTPVQYAHFKNWADGTFVTGTPVKPEFLSEALDRIALEACSGGAFYPGMEVPRITRNPKIYAAPFRFKHKPGADPLNPSDPAAPAFDGLVAGQVTEGLAVPWQADFFACQMELDNAWWPATRPDHVLQARPARPVDSQSEDMLRWDAGIESYKEMVARWHRLGIARKVEAVPADPDQAKQFEKFGADVEVDPASGTKRYYFYMEKERELPR